MKQLRHHDLFSASGYIHYKLRPSYRLIKKRITLQLNKMF